MVEQLVSGMVLNDRYRITKLISCRDGHGVYLARDIKVTDKCFIVKEYVFPENPAFSEEELKIREEAYLETLEVIANFQHKSLPRIIDFFREAKRHYVVMENVEGVTLKALADMSVGMFQERQIAEWLYDIAEALLYLHSRPKPFIHSELDPDHIMLDAENNVQIVNLGITRFFNPRQDFKAFTTSFVDLTDDFYELGRTVYFLFTKKVFEPNQLTIDLPDCSDQMQKIVSRCLSDNPARNYRDVRELMMDIDKVLHPKAADTGEVKAAAGKASLFPSLQAAREHLGRLGYAILSQKISYFAAEVIGLLLISAVIWISLTPGWNYTRTGPFVMVACSSELLTLDAAARKLLDRQEIPGGYGDIAPAKEGVYLSSPQRSRIDIMEVIHNKVIGSVKVARSPSRMLRSGTILFCINEPSCNISVISTGQNKMISAISTADKPSDIAYSPRRNRLYISCPQIDRLQVVDPIGNFNRGFFRIKGGTGALALDPEETSLFIATSRFYGLQRFDLAARKVVETYYGLGFSKVTAMQFDSQGKNLYILDSDKNQLVVFSPSEKKVLYTVKVMKNPAAMTFQGTSRLWIANSGSHTVSIVDLTSHLVEATLATGRNPCAIRYFQ